MKHVTLMALGFGALLAASCGRADPDPSVSEQFHRVGDAERGRQLFLDKGCVICHAINGVGGKAAPALDAQTEADIPDPVGFAARMWRGAPAMIELQSLELGYTIWLEPQEMVDLASFAASAKAQNALTLDIVDADLANSFLNEQFWETEDWDEFLKDGQETGPNPTP